MTLIGGHAGFGGLFHGPLWLYMMAPFFLLSGGNPFWSLIPLYLLISLGLIMGGFFILSYLYGKTAGILFAAMMTFSSVFINTISFTSNSQVMPLIFLIYLFTIIKFLRGKDVWLIPNILLIGIGMHFESAFAIMLFPITVSAILYRRNLPSVKLVVIGLALFLVSISNFLIFDLRHQFLMTHAFLSLITGHVSHTKSDLVYAGLVGRLHDRIFWFSQTFTSVLSDPGNRLVLLFFIFVLAGSLALLVKTKGKQTNENKEMIFLLIAIVVSFVLYMFFPLGLQEHYIQSLFVAAVIILVLAMRSVSMSKIGSIIVILFLLCNILPGIVRFWQIISNRTPYISSSEGTYINQLHAVDSVFNDAKGKPFGYFVYDAPIVTYSMDYLMWWRGKTKYHYIPVSQKLPLTYLVLLPAPTGDIHAHDFWKKYTVRTNGRVLEEKTIAGNIEIQKLAVDPKEQAANSNYYMNVIFR